MDSFDEIDRRDVYDRLQSTARLSRTWGDCYGYLMVATGRAELMVDPVVAVWDLAPLLPILEEAGGTFTDWQGRRTIHSGQAIATNGLVLDEVLAIVREACVERNLFRLPEEQRNAIPFDEGNGMNSVLRRKGPYK